MQKKKKKKNVLLNGNLYGTAYQGGANNCGSIFTLTSSGTLLWYYSFPCAPGGANPVGPLLQGADGNFYGTTSQGGIQASGPSSSSTTAVQFLFCITSGASSAAQATARHRRVSFKPPTACFTVRR